MAQMTTYLVVFKESQSITILMSLNEVVTTLNALLCQEASLYMFAMFSSTYSQ
ncbi:Hypothetical predicted protein, partial [Podarcis lilfordi]